MILADKIVDERKLMGLSQEELAERLGVSRQAVSKWESAQSMPDLQRVIQLAELFGVSTDYLLKDDAVKIPGDGLSEYKEGDCRCVTVEEANAFLDYRRHGSRLIALATALCIISPAILILLAGFSEYGIWGITETIGAAVGMIWLFVAVAAAVVIFIYYGTAGKEFEYIQKQPFETAYGVTGIVKERRKSFEKTYALGLSAGIAICVISVLPLIIAAVMEASDVMCTSMTSLLFLIVAAGVYLIIRVSTVKGSFDALLQEGDYTKSEKRVNRKMELFGGVYWCAVTAGYLGWSFATDNWNFTWIVWPVAGVLFAAAASVVRMLSDKEE